MHIIYTHTEDLVKTHTGPTHAILVSVSSDELCLIDSEGLALLMSFILLAHTLFLPLLQWGSLNLRGDIWWRSLVLGLNISGFLTC